MISDLYRHRRAFWTHVAEHAPELHARSAYATEHSRWIVVGPLPLVVALFVANGSAGIFVRGARGVRTAVIRELLFPNRELLARALGKPDIRLGTYFPLASSVRADMTDETNWPRAVRWFVENAPLYERAMADLQRR
ncbi:MAG: hypothetical protein AB7I79_10840 [Rhizobiaceae bacterium]